MLKGKNAVIYGGGGSLGSAVAQNFANAGATVFLTGRNVATLQPVASKIIATGGKVHIEKVDALSKSEVEDHLQRVLYLAGSIDISFNAIGFPVVQNVHLINMTMSDFVDPITTAMQTHFLTASAAGKQMAQQNSGVILSLTATPGGIGYPYTGGFGPVCVAIETFYKTLASELGVHGVRCVTMRSGGSPDSKTFKEAIDTNPSEMAIVLRGLENDTMLKKLPMMQDIANLAAFLASDLASVITGVTVDVTAGSTAALNYRVERK